MPKPDKELLLRRTSAFYIGSRDFNGMPIQALQAESGLTVDVFKAGLVELIREGLIGVIYDGPSLNPHIVRTGFEDEETQIVRLQGEELPYACVYPRPRHLTKIIDKSQYADRPYALPLAVGEAQLAYRAFDLSVLEFYRNDPRYGYASDDISGRIYIKDAFYESSQMEDRDKILLQSFGFSYDEDLNRAVAVFLRYLADLSPEHQQVWRAKELSGTYRLHPDYHRTAIVGEWQERASIFDAFLKELWLINQMSEAIGRPHFFRRDFGQDGDEKPPRFGFLVRPTLEEFNAFVHLLDKMISENINKKFFQKDVHYEIEQRRSDGRIQVQNRGTLKLLDDWIRKSFRPNGWEPWDSVMAAFEKVRRRRQRPAHAISENEFNQEYIQWQRELIIDAYQGVRTLRMLLENHPRVKAASIQVPDWLREGRIWTY